MDLSSWHVDDSNARELHTKVTDATARANRAFYLAYNFRATRAFEGFFGVLFEGLLLCIWDQVSAIFTYTGISAFYERSWKA